jgi:hypothetical protein
MSDDVNKKPDENEDEDEFDKLPPYIQLLAIITDVTDDYLEIMVPHEIMGILDIVKHKVLRACVCEMDEYDEMMGDEGESNDGSSESGDDFSTID